MRLFRHLRTVLIFSIIALFIFALAGCKEEPDPILPHEHTVVEHEGKDPTCTAPGWTAYETCSECDTYSTYKPIQPLGHQYSNTCTPDGEVHTVFCTRCSDVVASAHTWGEPELTAPTCTTAGSKDYTCTDCGAEKSEVVSLLGHDYEETILSNGQQGLVCTVCSASVAVHTHEWDTLSIITAPTCTAAGEEELICTVCSTKKSEILAAIGHDFSEEYKPNGDVHSLFCNNCNEAIGNLNHDWVSLGVTAEPDCSNEGAEHFKCTVCGAEKTVILDVLPEQHVETGWVTLTPATALEAGEKVRVCVSCHKQFERERIAPDVESMDRVYLTGNYAGAYVGGEKKEVGMTVTYVYADGTSFDSYATIKAQGASSLGYPKKNYTIKFYNDANHENKNKIDLGWGKQSKYVMKANWVDYSQSRNVMSCRLWGDIVRTRATSVTQQRLAALPTNGGAIDGYPIAVFMNGNFHGLYTMNVPKDEWMFGMGEKDENNKKSETEALLATDDWNHTDFYSTIGSFIENSDGDIVSANGGWEVIYYGGDDYNWVAESFDRLITFCQENQGQAFRDGIAQYLDVDAAIDYLIYMYANCMHDNASKNMLWATYDGNVWIPSIYDQDGSFGQVWDGVRFSGAHSSLPSVINGRIDVGINYGPGTGHTPKFILWDRIWNTFTYEILVRYDELRATVLSTSYMISKYKQFEAQIPASMFEAEYTVWASDRASWWAGKGQTTPYDYTAYHYDYIYTWIANRMSYLDRTMSDIRYYYNTN